MLVLIQIERDEADYALYDFACTYARSTIAHCVVGTGYSIDRYWTKYPSKLSPTWNLIYLFPYNIWALFFVSIVGVTLFFNISGYVLKKMGVEPQKTEIVLSPVRLGKLKLYIQSNLFLL